MADSDLLIKMAGDVEALRQSVGKAVNVMGNIADSAKKIADTANKAFNNMGKVLRATFKAVAQFVVAAVKEIINIVKEMSGAVFDADARLRSLMSPEQQAATQSLADKWKTVTDALQNMYNIVAEALVPVFHTVFDTVILPNLDDMYHLVGGIGNFITSVVVPALQQWGPLIGDIAGHFITAFGDILNGDLEAAIDRVSYAVLQVFGTDAGLSVREFLRGIMGIGEAVQGGNWGDVFSIITDALTGAWNTAVKWFNDVGWPSFMNIVSTSWAALQTWWSNEGWPGFYTAMVNLWTWFTGTGWPWLMETIQIAWGNLQIWWGNEGWPGLVKAWDDLQKWWNTTGVQDLNKLLTDTWTGVQTTVTWLGSQIGNALWAGITSWFGEGSKTWLRDTLNNMGAAVFGETPPLNRAGGGMFGGSAIVGEAGPEIVHGAGMVTSHNTVNNFNLTMHVDRDTAGALSHSFKMMQAAVGA